jgi:hypothetical protein
LATAELFASLVFLREVLRVLCGPIREGGGRIIFGIREVKEEEEAQVVARPEIWLRHWRIEQPILGYVVQAVSIPERVKKKPGN